LLLENTILISPEEGRLSRATGWEW